MTVKGWELSIAFSRQARFPLTGGYNGKDKETTGFCGAVRIFR